MRVPSPDQELPKDGHEHEEERALERHWMANRYQCGSRCIRGMMKGWEALRMHLRAELPDSISDEDVAMLTSSKFRCLAALQVYDKYKER